MLPLGALFIASSITLSNANLYVSSNNALKPASSSCVAVRSADDRAKNPKMHVLEFENRPPDIRDCELNRTSLLKAALRYLNLA